MFRQIFVGFRLPTLKIISRAAAVLMIVSMLFLTTGSRLQPAKAAGGDPFSLAWTSSDPARWTFQAAWGDVDRDGYLDLATAEYPFIRIYHNDGGVLSSTATWIYNTSGYVYSIAWGDVNGDGYLDLVAATSWGVILFINHNGVLELSTWQADEQDVAYSVAWGDVDADGLPDLAVAYGGSTAPEYRPVRIYRNVGGTLNPTAAWSSPVSNYYRSVAWGDMNGDGKLDLAVGSAKLPNNVQVFQNSTTSGNPITMTQVYSAPITDSVMNLAWGDYDNDGHLDLAVGIEARAGRIYHNIKKGSVQVLDTTPVWTAPASSAPFSETGSMAWGDVNSDGYLDLVVTSTPLRVYLNQAGTLPSTSDWSSVEMDDSAYVALGDADNDGNLDIAVANGGHDGQPKRLYHNNGFTLQPKINWSIQTLSPGSSLAWGDMDNDGDLDLAVGNYDYSANQTAPQPAVIYRNTGGVLSPVWTSTEKGNVTSVAWGDINNDGYLDLAVAMSPGPVRIYLNLKNGTLATTAAWSSTEQDYTNALAFGDFNDDGYLDLAAASGRIQPDYQHVRVYKNDHGQLISQAVWSSPEIQQFTSLAWGDIDGDGNLDLAVGAVDGVFLYRNTGGVLSPKADNWTPIDAGNAISLAWGDFDGDGKPDLAVGNSYQQNRVYHNEGGKLSNQAVWSSNEIGYTYCIRAVDFDGDGDLDLMTAGFGYLRLYRNDHGVLTPNAVWQVPIEAPPGTILATNYSYSIALGDINGDGDLDLAVAAANQNYGGYLDLYPNRRDGQGLPGTVPVVSVAHPGPQADFYASGAIQSGIIPISYRLTSPQSDSVAAIHAWYSPDGGGRWLPAQPTSDTITTNLSSSPTGTDHVFQWDVTASGFFGQSDNVVFRIEAVAGTGNHLSSVPGPFLRASYSAQSLPFRVRGMQVQVFNETAQAGNEVSSAIVYRLLNGQTNGAKPIAGPDGTPFVTSNNGFLQGRGEIQTHDKLVALQPIGNATGNIVLYHTSAAPNATGLDALSVDGGGVQTLVVSKNNPLILFNLKVSLEWDARQDTQFLEQLNFDLKRASELLYDWSNGQVALGKISLYQDRQHWADADVRIYATDNRRPAATLGGIVSGAVPDPANSDLVYQPGMVHIGRVWNRYGSAGSSTGEDWPRALAHELGHYALFMNDDYLGFDQNGHLVKVESCKFTAMSDPYRDDYSEFKPAATWADGCLGTLSNQTTGRADWTTIHTFYPALDPYSINSGPSSLPLAVTQVIETEDPPLPAFQALLDPRFYLKDENEASLQPGSSARAILYRDDRLEDLGSPTVDSILAPGAQPGDQLCVLDFAAHRVGCKTVLANDTQQLTMGVHDDWQPDVILAPQDDHTINIKVSHLGQGVSLAARLYSGDGRVSDEIQLTSALTYYSGTFNLAQPTVDGIVLIWEVGVESHVVISDYSMGGSLAQVRSGYARLRSGFAPASSSDGQVFLYANDLTFPADQFYTLQAATSVTLPPSWMDLIGHAYWLSQSTGAPPLAGASISMGYADRAVSPGEEAWLKVYRWNEITSNWDALDTRLDTVENNAVAVVTGPGLYALISTVELPLYGPGWELFSYPVQDALPVGQALMSIGGFYNSVYWFDNSSPANPWKGFSLTAPAWANDLVDLQFGKVYWINLTQSLTLKLKPGASASQLSAGPATPPATYYGEVGKTAGFLPQAGQTVTAWVNGVACGTGVTQSNSGKIVYAIHVLADGPSSPGCGITGSLVHFQVGTQSIITTALWNYDQFWPLDLQPPRFQFIPWVAH